MGEDVCNLNDHQSVQPRTVSTERQCVVHLGAPHVSEIGNSSSSSSAAASPVHEEYTRNHYGRQFFSLPILFKFYLTKIQFSLS